MKQAEKPSAPPLTKLPYATVTQGSNATLFCDQFEDIYYSPDDGLAETNHVFVNGNDLQRRFAALQKYESFTIGELGFGTGLNFLTTLTHWQNRGHDNGILNFVSMEAYPLSPADFTHAMAAIALRWPELAETAQSLKAQYPPHCHGLHTIRFAADVRLLLWFGDARTGLAQIKMQADAWYLDGFSPAKNPDMWSDTLMNLVAQASKPQATLASFTAAGHVRQKLQQSGFECQRVPGFGRKKHMTVATMKQKQTQTHAHSPAWFDINSISPTPPSAKIAVIGAGIAGAALAFHLQQQGYQVTVFEAAHIAAGASGNPAGLLLPRLDADDTATASFYRTAWLYALEIIRQLETQTSVQICDHKGGIRISDSEKNDRRYQHLLAMQALPTSHLTDANCEGLPGKAHLNFTQGGTVDPAAFVKALLRHSDIMFERVVSLQPHYHGWEMSTQDQSYVFDCVFLANSAAIDELLPDNYFRLGQSIGQIEHLHEGPSLERAITSGHYITKWKNNLYAGASHETASAYSPDDLQWKAARADQTIEALKPLFPSTTSWVVDEHQGRASIRAITADSIPIAGPVPDWGWYQQAYEGLAVGAVRTYPAARYRRGLFVLNGLGSRGLTTAPILAYHLVSLISASPSPLTKQQADLVHPARSLIRSIKRHEH